MFEFFADMPFDTTGYAGKEERCIPKLTKNELRRYFLFPPEMPNRFYHGIQLKLAVKYGQFKIGHVLNTLMEVQYLK